MIKFYNWPGKLKDQITFAKLRDYGVYVVTPQPKHILGRCTLISTARKAFVSSQLGKNKKGETVLQTRTYRKQRKDK